MEKGKNKITVSDIICAMLVLILCVIVPIVTIATVRQKENEYFALYVKYRNVREEYAEEFAEIETAYEFMEDLYGEQKDRIDYLKAIIDRLTSEKDTEQDTYSKEFVEQILNDFDDAIEYMYNYYDGGFHDNNPDVDFVGYLAIRNPELLARLLEYTKEIY